MPEKANIILVDDHTVVRKGLRSLIERLGNYEVVAEYDNGKDLIEALPQLDIVPDLVVMDLEMPVMGGRETVKELKRRGITYPVLVLTLETDESKIIELFKSGIRGYLPKSATAEVLRKAINDVLTTGYYHDEIFAKAMTYEAESDANMLHATEREKEFLRLVCSAEEPTYEQIAQQMEVSRRTVDGYRESLFTKFNIKSKTGLVLFAIKYGIVKLDS